MSTFTIDIPIRRFTDPELARRCGYTKNHFQCEAFMVGKWRLVGFYTTHQINKGLVEKKVRHLMKVNANGAKVDSLYWQEDLPG